MLEPGQPYKHGWHIDALAEHLEAVTRGQILRLLINVPPGTMKSILVGVMFPAWEWGPKGLAHMRYLGTSHSHPLAIRDNLKMRRLIASAWYQERWGDRVRLMSDQNAKLKFENDATGFREAMAFTGLTGSRGDRVLIDDPLSVDDAASEKKREAVNDTFREAVPTRLNNPDSSAIVTVMQRLHQDDVSGLIIAQDFGYEHLMLPMEFERDRRCITSIGFQDPRTKEGELLFPERFSREVVERDKKVMGAYASAGQFQQRPAPREGGIFQPDQIQVIEAIPFGTRFVRGWDLAASEDDGDWTAGMKLGELPDGRWVIADVARLQGRPETVEAAIKNTASRDGHGVEISLPQDPGQSGKSQVAYLTRQLAGYIVHSSTESGDKIMRANPFAAQVNVGNVTMLRAPWNDELIGELRMFPNGSYDDQVDGCSRAFNRLSGSGTWAFGSI